MRAERALSGLEILAGLACVAALFAALLSCGCAASQRVNLAPVGSPASQPADVAVQQGLANVVATMKTQIEATAKIAERIEVAASMPVTGAGRDATGFGLWSQFGPGAVGVVALAMVMLYRLASRTMTLSHDRAIERIRGKNAR